MKLPKSMPHATAPARNAATFFLSSGAIPLGKCEAISGLFTSRPFVHLGGA
jgi:hypothetical protein